MKRKTKPKINLAKVILDTIREASSPQIIITDKETKLQYQLRFVFRKEKLSVICQKSKI